MAMSSLDKLPKHSEVIYALTPLADKYFDIGMQLDLDYEQLKAIENDHKGNQSRCLIETIILWRCCHSGECSWLTLAEAVNRVGGHDKLVRELKERDKAKGLMETDLKAQMHHPPERANEGTQSEYESGYSSQSDSVQSENSSGSEAECFELAPGCGCTDKNPCSLYALCAGECPNPTRKRVPLLRKKPKIAATSSQSEIPFEEEYDFEDYEERTKEIQKSFGSFVCKTSHHFKESNESIKELTLYLRSTYSVMKPRMEELSKVTDFMDFFGIVIDQACSWFNYGVIKDLILRFCTSAKSCLNEYEACFKEYAEQRLPKGMKHIEIGGGARKGGKQLVIKIDREWEEVTFSELDKLRGTFASILGIHRSDLYLADIREGCIMMTFMITEELAGKLFPSRTCLTSSQVDSFKDERVLSVKCGSLNWRAVASNNKNDTARPETRAKLVPQNLLGWRLKIFDIRVMMMVMLLLFLVFAAFGVLLLHMQVAQVNSDRTQADLPTLPLLQESARRSGSLIERPQPYVYLAGICPAHLPTKDGPTSSHWKNTSKRVPVIDSNEYTNQSFLNVRHINFRLHASSLITVTQPKYRIAPRIIAHLARAYPAHLPTEDGPTSSHWKETSTRVPVIDSNKYIQSFLNAHFLNTSEYQQFFEETDAVVECPAFFGDQQGVICTRDNAMVVTDDQFSLIIQNIQQSDSTSAVYRCSITTRPHESPFITITVFKRDSLTPRIVERSSSIIQINNHYKNTIPILRRDAQQFLEGNYTCDYNDQAFYMKILRKSVNTYADNYYSIFIAPPPNCSKEDETRNEEGTIVLEICDNGKANLATVLHDSLH